MLEPNPGLGLVAMLPTWAGRTNPSQLAKGLQIGPIVLGFFSQIFQLGKGE